MITALQYTALLLNENSTWDDVVKEIHDGFDISIFYSSNNEHWFTTGGWDGGVSGNVSLTFTKDGKIYWFANPGSNTGTTGWLRFNKCIDFTPYTKLYVKGYFKRVNYNVASWVSQTIQLINSSGNVVKTLYSLGSNETLTDPVFDVSDVNVPVYFKVSTSQVVSGYNNTIEITKMWAE